jgi:ABC-type sulfate transport system permease component
MKSRLLCEASATITFSALGLVAGCFIYALLRSGDYERATMDAAQSVTCSLVIWWNVRRMIEREVP